MLQILEQILLGNDSAPLRRALMDSGLGTALSDGSGFDGDNRDTLFCLRPEGSGPPTRLRPWSGSSSRPFPLWCATGFQQT